jgi:tetratricopeptide (TPR) repeat protein
MPIELADRTNNLGGNRGRGWLPVIVALALIAVIAGVWFFNARPTGKSLLGDSKPGQSGGKKNDFGTTAGVDKTGQQDQKKNATGQRDDGGRKPNETPVAAKTPIAPFPKNPGYVGIDQCVDCHKDRVAEFKQTRHYLACRPPDADMMPAAFTAKGSTFQPQVEDVRFVMRKAGDRFTVTTEHSDGGARLTLPVDFVYGLGQHTDHGYFGFDGEELFELPVSWLFPTGEWGATAFDPDGQGHLGRPTTTRCMECHNTWFAHRAGTENRYDPKSFVLGVQCEVCHGPAKDHVAHHQGNPADKTARKIVQPTKFSRQQLLDLCAYCHSNALKAHGPALQYRPGEPLADFYTTLTPTYPEFDHVANQDTYMRQSKCFQKSEMTCIDCHSPHARRPVELGAETCAKCHQPQACKDQPNLPEAVRGDCVSCHMPQRNKMGVNFDTAKDRFVPPVKRYDHRIAVFPEARMDVLRKHHLKLGTDKDKQKASELTSALEKHWLEEAKSRLAEDRLMGAIDAYREALSYVEAKETRKRLDDVLARISKGGTASRLAKKRFELGDRQGAIESFEEAIQANPKDSFSIGSLGTIYAVMGKKADAMRLWGDVVKTDPNDAYGEGMIAWSNFLDKDFERSLAAFARTEAITPGQPKTHFNIALVLGSMERFDEAIERCEKVLELEPRNINAALKLGEFRLRKGEPEEAVRTLRAAAEWSGSQRPDVLILLYQALMESNLPDEARGVERDIYSLLEGAPPQIALQVRQRIEQIRQSRRSPQN